MLSVVIRTMIKFEIDVKLEEQEECNDLDFLNKENERESNRIQ